MNEDGNGELLFTIFMMVVLLALGVAAVVVFVRVWRKEHKGSGKNFFE
jgi:hypothetical protein